jgi:hypothetical protein
MTVCIDASFDVTVGGTEPGPATAAARPERACSRRLSDPGAKRVANPSAK